MYGSLHYFVFLSILGLFLAYVNGAARLCREILRAGGSLATVNKFGTSIFNAEVPTKKLLFSLLGNYKKTSLLNFNDRQHPQANINYGTK